MRLERCTPISPTMGTKSTIRGRSQRTRKQWPLNRTSSTMLSTPCFGSCSIRLTGGQRAPIISRPSPENHQPITHARSADANAQPHPNILLRSDRHEYLSRLQLHVAAERGGRPSIRPLQCFMLLDPVDNLQLMRAFAHDITEAGGELLAPLRRKLDPTRRPRIGCEKDSDFGIPSFVRLCPTTSNPVPNSSVILRISIRFVSSDLGNHPLGHDFQHFFGLLDQKEFEIYAFNLRPQPDPTRWRSHISSSVENWVKKTAQRQFRMRVADFQKTH